MDLDEFPIHLEDASTGDIIDLSNLLNFVDDDGSVPLPKKMPPLSLINQNPVTRPTTRSDVPLRK